MSYTNNNDHVIALLRLEAAARVLIYIQDDLLVEDIARTIATSAAHADMRAAIKQLNEIQPGFDNRAAYSEMIARRVA